MQKKLPADIQNKFWEALGRTVGTDGSAKQFGETTRIEKGDVETKRDVTVVSRPEVTVGQLLDAGLSNPDDHK